MLKKIDNALKLIWFLFWPILISFLVIVMAWDIYVWYDDDMAELWFNIACLLAVIIISGWLVNFILDIVLSIIRHIEKKKNKENDDGLQ